MALCRTGRLPLWLPSLAEPGTQQACERRMREISAKVRTSFIASARSYGARRVWHDVLTEGFNGGLAQDRAADAGYRPSGHRPRRRGLPKDEGERLTSVIATKYAGPGILVLTGRTANGSPILPMFGRRRAGSTWLP